MGYMAYFLCDTCGHKWKTYYDRLKMVEHGDACDNCINRPPYRKNFWGCVVEPYFYKQVEE